jgi:hypothetical protein
MKKFTAALDEQFNKLYLDWRALARKISPEMLYYEPDSGSRSVGDFILRSAAIVEQTFGGITANLWDDPFEWTLPETLSSPEKLSEYLDEVEATRRRGFELIRSDDDLWKEIMAPAGRIHLISLLLDSLQRARHHQANAAETYRLIQFLDQHRHTSTAGNFVQ